MVEAIFRHTFWNCPYDNRRWKIKFARIWIFLHQQGTDLEEREEIECFILWSNVGFSVLCSLGVVFSGLLHDHLLHIV